MPKITVSFWTDAPVSDEGAAAAANAMAHEIGHGTIGESAHVIDVSVDHNHRKPDAAAKQVEKRVYAPLDAAGRAQSTTTDPVSHVSDEALAQAERLAKEHVEGVKDSAETQNAPKAKAVPKAKPPKAPKVPVTKSDAQKEADKEHKAAAAASDPPLKQAEQDAKPTERQKNARSTKA